ncbi:MAG: hypothetical protein ACI396_10105 [Acutalibacteraceae bacterium]
METQTIESLKVSCDDEYNSNDSFDIEFEVITPVDTTDSRHKIINDGLKIIDEQIAEKQSVLDELNSEIDRLTNHADGLDYAVAVGSGILCGLIDSFFVGEFSLDRGREWGSEKVNNFVMKIAKSQGYKGDSLRGAIDKLEGNFPIASDGNMGDLGGALQHHLRDFAHHPTLVGLIFSMLTQFTGNAYGTDEKGLFKVVPVKNQALIGKDLPQKILFGVVFWFFHMVSDMAGSSSSAGMGTGLPGPLLSLAKELSVLPFFRNIKIGDKDISVWISKLFNGTLLAKRDASGKIIEKVPFDLRTELGIAHELGRQAIPVIINELLVRVFYFGRHFLKEYKEKGDIHSIEWKKVVPFKNRTIVRMMTIASGTFTAVDLADAAIRSAVKSGGVTSPLFFKNMILKVNFVGIGRFAIAIGTDIKMGIQRSRLRNERIHLYSQLIMLSNAKVFYKQADMWISAENAGKTIEEAYSMIEKTTAYAIESMKEINQNLQNIDSYLPGVEENNSGLLEQIEDVLKWGLS